MEQIFRRESVRARILGNPLGPVFQEYIAYLKARGHTLSSVHQYVFALEHFGNWLGRDRSAMNPSTSSWWATSQGVAARSRHHAPVTASRLH
jgi:hypothetical protein